MILNQSIKLDLSMPWVGKVLRIHEGTTTGAENILLSVYNNESAFDLTGKTIKYDATVAGYLAEEDASATFSGNVITIPITSNMTAKSGTLLIDVKILNGTEILYIQTVRAFVDRRVIGNDTIIDVSGTTIVARLNELSDDIEDLETSMQGVQGDISSLETSMQGVQGDIEDIETSYMLLAPNVNSQSEIDAIKKGQLFNAQGDIALKTSNSGYASLERKSNKDSTLTPSAIEGHYPSSKAVVDFAKANRPRYGSYVLSAANWSGNTYNLTSILTADGATANTKVDLDVNSTFYSALQTDGVERLWVENNNGTFTVHADGNVPTTDINVQLTLTEVREVE